MNGFRNWIARYMTGRYGSDELNRFLLIICAILLIIGIFVTRRILNLIVIVLLIFVYCRMFSRNIAKRQQENMKYLQLKAKVTGGRGSGGTSSYGGPRPGAGPRYGAGPGYGAAGGAGATGGKSWRKKKQRPAPGKRIFICPACKGSLQVPVGAGRIRIKCPHCGSEFEETV